MKTTEKFLPRVFLTLTLVTAATFAYLETVFYAFYADSVDPLAARLYQGFFASTSVNIAAVLLVVSSVALTWYLRPLALAQEDPRLVPLADRRIRSFYWLVLFGYLAFYLAGTVLGVVLVKAQAHMPYYLLIAGAVGLLDASIIWQMTGFILAPVRRQLNLATIAAGDRDVSFTARLVLMAVSSGLAYFAAPVYIANYFLKGHTSDVPPFYASALLCALVVTGFTLWQLWYFARFNLRVIASIKAVMAGLRNAGSNLSERIPVSGYDEMGELAAEFNSFMEFLNTGIMEKLRGSSRIVFDSSLGLSASAQEITATSNQQAAAVKEIVTTMEDIGQLVHDMSQRLSHVSALSQETSGKASDGVSSIGRALDMFGQVKQTTVTTIDRVSSLNDQLGAVTEIVRIIENIANQIRIIAFNASLEATAAGEAGRNFQIVADEVKRLADNTMASAKDIRAKVGQILASARQVVDVSRQSSEVIEEGWDLVAQLPQVFEGIHVSAQESAGETGSANQSARQQVESFEQVLATLKEISQGVENFAVSTRQTASTSNALKETAEQLTQMIVRYTGSGDRGPGSPAASA
jgi:methyl-accepting chemotaxis protein